MVGQLHQTTTAISNRIETARFNDARTTRIEQTSTQET